MSNNFYMCKINSGIWRITLGNPEEFTPVSLREHEPLQEAISNLLETEIPFSTENIAFRVSSTGCVTELPLKAGEGIYGFGLQLKSFNQLGKKKHLRPNADPKSDSGASHAPVPFFVSTAGYGVLVDTARYVSFYCGSNKKKGQSEHTSLPRREQIVYTEADLYGTNIPEEDRTMLIDVPAAKGIDIYLFTGPDILTVVRRYVLFSGGGCIPPDWGLGVWYRTFAGFNCNEVIALTKKLREDKIPCDVVGLEPGWQSYSYPCSYTWDEIRGEGHEKLLEQTK